MKKWIIWLTPINKRILVRQFHTEADNMKQALQNLSDTADFEYRVMGVSDYYNLGEQTNDEKDKLFVNNKFYS